MLISHVEIKTGVAILHQVKLPCINEFQLYTLSFQYLKVLTTGEYLNVFTLLK